jgi:hypothetical protein
MITNCPVCGKGFDVLWPHLWRYRRGNSYLCSWKCLRLADNEREKEAKMDKQKRVRLSAEVMAKAVKMFRDGDSGLDQYLADNGVTNIKKWKENARTRFGAPEQPTLGDAMEGMKSAADEFFGKCEDMGLKTITDEDVEAKLPDAEEEEFEKRTTVTAIRVEGLGEFYFDKKFKAIDWRTEGGDEVSLGPAWWLQLAEDLPLILKKLGVEL